MIQKSVLDAILKYMILNMMKILNLALLVQHRQTVYRARSQMNHLLEQHYLDMK